MRVLVTGGAGFIGGHIVDKLLAKGYEVTVLDCLEEPTHYNKSPNYLAKNVLFIEGNILETEKLKEALRGVSVIFHEAATGGFTNNVSKYYEWNTLATAKLWECIEKEKIKLKKFIVASSVAVYGEGKYACKKCGVVFPSPREQVQLEKKKWNLCCPKCEGYVIAQATDEKKPVHPLLHYSQSKYDQERISLIAGKRLTIPVVALRYFLTYGPRQSATNQYTGVCSLFLRQILEGKSPLIYEDGLQTRDFVYVDDIAEANMFVLENEGANNKVLNVGSGKPTAIKYIAENIAKELGKEIAITASNQFRLGDVRDIFADITAIQALGFKPKVTVEEGIRKYVRWFMIRYKQK